MKRTAPVLAVLALLVAGSLTQGDRGREEALGQLRTAFEQYSGARLVFDARELPPGDYHDMMPPLSDEDQVAAARIALREVRKLPPGYLGAIGLKAVGIFQACVSKSGDGFRPYDEKLKGYRFYGIWNGKDGVAGAYYSDQQLPLTLHHEIFHHVDAISRGKTDPGNLGRDEAFKDALSGKAPYPAVKIAPDDLAALKKLAQGRVLESAVSDYAKKSIGEDKAETARHLMSALPDALVQVATRPELPGSQRLLHVLHKYEQSLPGGGPDVRWFVDVALGRAKEAPPGRGEEKAKEPANEQAALPKAPAGTSRKSPAEAVPATSDPPGPRAELDNPYLSKVDAALDDPEVRAAIRRVQPACVRLGGASGVNLTPDGHVLTCAHVAKKEGAKLSVLFPDGRKFTGTCTALDEHLDLAVVTLSADEELPSAPLAKAAPEKGTAVVCVGQPGGNTPAGKPTNYQPFHVSTGMIRGYLDDPAGDQSPLGRCKHDAWTYWGHSGSPLFNEAGQVVALHNSWDSSTAMRHAVTHQAIVEFLKREKVPFSAGD
jgi:S1-C subfamily serine protease